MLNNLLLSFFYAMPAVVALVISSDFKNPATRAIFFWGGCIFIGLAVLFLAPMFLCEGSVVSGYGNCTALGGLFQRSLMMAAAYIYVLGGPALALIGYLAEVIHNRRAART